VVTVPGATAGSPSAPTGLVANTTPSFVVSANGKSGSSIFIFANEDGTISGWSPAVDLHNVTGGPSGKKNHLLFTAGIGDEGHGLFGFIRPGEGGEDHRNDDD